MKIIILATLSALILLGVGVYIIWNFSERIKIEKRTYFRLEDRWFYGFLGYTSLTVTIFLILVLQTSLTQQEKILFNTQTRFQDEMSAFRDRLSEQTDKLYSQLNEKAELTGSEIEVRGKLRNEMDLHRRTQEDLHLTKNLLNQAQILFQSTYRSYVDSLNTERALHKSTKDRLDHEARAHTDTRNAHDKTQRNLSKAEQRLSSQDSQLKDLNKLLNRAQASAKNAQEIANQAAKRLLQKADEHQQSLMLIQATADTIFQKVMKHARVPGPEPTK
ncbi:MAG: hypothetical protein ACI8V2_001498 [Candidatus Latescibacterota bacterium]|jgi:hypothetical protein